MTAEEIYDNYILTSGHTVPFHMIWCCSLDSNRAELRWQRFDSRERDYCLPLLESIIAAPDFLGLPVTWTNESLPSISMLIR